jgi:hypothetical protein
MELNSLPDLLKTKLCYNFLRGRCVRNPCNYAHGSNELRSGDGVNTTEVRRQPHSGSKLDKPPYAQSGGSSMYGSTEPGTDEEVYEESLLPPGLLFE